MPHPKGRRPTIWETQQHLDEARAQERQDLYIQRARDRQRVLQPPSRTPTLDRLNQGSLLDRILNQFSVRAENKVAADTAAAGMALDYGMRPFDVGSQYQRVLYEGPHAANLKHRKILDALDSVEKYDNRFLQAIDKSNIASAQSLLTPEIDLFGMFQVFRNSEDVGRGYPTGENWWDKFTNAWKREREEANAAQFMGGMGSIENVLPIFGAAHLGIKGIGSGTKAAIRMPQAGSITAIEGATEAARKANLAADESLMLLSGERSLSPRALSAPSISREIEQAEKSAQRTFMVPPGDDPFRRPQALPPGPERLALPPGEVPPQRTFEVPPGSDPFRQGEDLLVPEELVDVPTQRPFEEQAQQLSDEFMGMPRVGDDTPLTEDLSTPYPARFDWEDEILDVPTTRPTEEQSIDLFKNVLETGDDPLLTEGLPHGPWLQEIFPETLADGIADIPETTVILTPETGLEDARSYSPEIELDEAQRAYDEAQAALDNITIGGARISNAERQAAINTRNNAEVQLDLVKQDVDAIGKKSPSFVPPSPPLPIERSAGWGGYLDWFRKFLRDPSRIDEWESTIEARRSERGVRAARMEEEVSRLRNEGYEVQDAIDQSMHILSGRLPTTKADIDEIVTPELSRALFDEVDTYFFKLPASEKETFEWINTRKILANALLGEPIPRKPGTEGGSAFSRLQRVFGDEVAEGISTRKPFSDMIEGISDPNTQRIFELRMARQTAPTRPQRVEYKPDIGIPPQLPMVDEAIRPTGAGFISDLDQPIPSSSNLFRRREMDPGILRDLRYRDTLSEAEEARGIERYKLEQAEAPGFSGVRPQYPLGTRYGAIEGYKFDDLMRRISEEDVLPLRPVEEGITDITGRSSYVMQKGIGDPLTIGQIDAAIPTLLRRGEINPQIEFQKDVALYRAIVDGMPGSKQVDQALQMNLERLANPAVIDPLDESSLLSRQMRDIDPEIEGLKDVELERAVFEHEIGQMSAPTPSTRILASNEAAKRLRTMADRQIRLMPRNTREQMLAWAKEAMMTGVDLANLLKGIMTMADLSYVRQQTWLIADDPLSFAESFWYAIRGAISEEFAKASDDAIKKHHYYPRYLLNFHLDELNQVSGPDFLRALDNKSANTWQRDEHFIILGGTRPIQRLAEHVPLLKISNRAYVTGLNKNNWNIYVKHMEMLDEQQMQYAAKQLEKPTDGKIFDLQKESNQFAQMLADFSGRGPMGKYGREHAEELNVAFFSIRNTVGRAIMIRHLWSPSKYVRKAAWRNVLKSIGLMTGLVLGGEQMGWWGVEKDPRNSNFMQPYLVGESGRLYFDPYGGLQQWVVLGARILPAIGGVKSRDTGRISSVDPEGTTRRMLRGKAGPAVSNTLEAWIGEDWRGQEIDRTDWMRWMKNNSMLSAQDVMDAWDAEGVLGLQTASPAAVLGIGSTSVPFTRSNILHMLKEEAYEKGGITKDDPIWDMDWYELSECKTDVCERIKDQVNQHMKDLATPETLAEEAKRDQERESVKYKRGMQAQGTKADRAFREHESPDIRKAIEANERKKEQARLEEQDGGPGWWSKGLEKVGDLPLLPFRWEEEKNP